MAKRKPDLQRAYETLKARQDLYDRFWQYYEGDQPVVYTAKRLDKIFRDVDAKFVQNWCAVVVDSVWDKVQLAGFVSSDRGVRERMAALWTANEMNLEADDAHQAALVTGEGYLIVWQEGDGSPEVYFNDPRMCQLFYDAERPRVKRFAAKWWDDEEEKRRLTLYYPDHLEYYRSRPDAKNVNDWKAFEGIGEAENPFEEVPVFHLRTGRSPISELRNAVPLQNGVNKLLIDMMVAAEYGAFKQRWIISNSENLGQLKNAPNEVWDLPAGDGLGQGTEVGEFGSTQLRNYFEAIDRMAISMAIITRTPKHFFFAQGNEISGEAMLAMEAPLNRKAAARIERFTPVWQRVAAFMLRLDGVEVDPGSLEPMFERPETLQPLTAAQARNFDVNSGMPLRTVLRREGWTQVELEELEEDREAERASAGNVGMELLGAFERNREREG